MKKDYVVGLADLVDVVPIGAWWGNGRKAKWFSPILLAVWDPDGEEYQSICRCAHPQSAPGERGGHP